MGVTIISAQHGNLRGETRLYSGEGTAIVEIEPSITSMNGQTIDFQTGYAQVVFSPFAGESLVITGENLERVTSIQMEYACPAKSLIRSDDEVFNYGWVYETPDLYIWSQVTGSIVVPSNPTTVSGSSYAQISYTINNSQQITIPFSTFQQLTSDNVDPIGDEYFSLTDDMPQDARNFVCAILGFGQYDDQPPLRLTDFWWNLRLWYQSGSHCTQQPFFIRFTPQYYATVYTGSLAIPPFPHIMD